ncbi:hypothetical protein DICPUDRAFT_83259 [Dictyostelium purpureum]|uniref:AMMECR1 domain-containing protein n=1 Tax=Dictyostelium purpureum TaxID=5786 RepID=F0ZZ10_DICPU|nr:uncharacterized protein DICPUDRAFT_83259 [Dictyostelium purpureum]EGC30818.1 hypothetical protein DICPUDRAFT_83259 [Dictyostelium purpureum]|eukprot:XP_003292661.1 hypothetical protein DICPUDRAFT_83259 [Dictyostelium purpureum]
MSGKSKFKASKEMVAYCWDTLIHHFESKPMYKPSFTNEPFPLFVTWKIDNKNYDEPILRGCIGTFSEKPLVEGLSKFSLTSALKDHRFSPITQKELPKLHCAVSLLLDFEEAKDVWDWEVGTHGIWIEFTNPTTLSTTTGTFLPEVIPEQQWSKEEALRALIKKAGYNGKVDQSFYSSIKLTRYQSTKEELSYKDYLEFKKHHHQHHIHQTQSITTAT